MRKNSSPIRYEVVHQYDNTWKISRYLQTGTKKFVDPTFGKFNVPIVKQDVVLVRKEGRLGKLFTRFETTKDKVLKDMIYEMILVETNKHVGRIIRSAI